MHIVFFILKIAGISVILLLALLIFLLILLLFVPFHCRLEVKLSKPVPGEKGRLRQAEGKAAVRFLFVFLTGVLEYKEGKAAGTVRLWGIPLRRRKAEDEAEDTAEKEAEKQGREKNKGKKKKENRKQKDTIDTKENRSSRNEQTKEDNEPKKDKEPKEDNAQNETKTENKNGIQKESTSDTAEQDQYREQMDGVPLKLSGFLKTLKKTAGGISSAKNNLDKKIEKFNSVRTNEHVRSGISKVWNGLKYLLSKIKPRKCKGFIHFGFDDPSRTGQLLGLLGIFYSFCGDTVRIEPDFEQQIFYGELTLKGKIQLYVFVKTAWKLYRDREVRYAYKRIRNL